MERLRKYLAMTITVLGVTVCSLAAFGGDLPEMRAAGVLATSASPTPTSSPAAVTGWMWN
jgi:hypothetical protein